MKVFYMDAETTGLDAVKHDIIQLAALVEIDGEVVDTIKLHCQPFSYANIEPSALEVHGITIEQLREFPYPQEAYGEIIALTDKHVDKYDKKDKFTPAGQNVPFDAMFLKEFFKKNGDTFYGSRFNYNYLDLLALTRLLKYRGLIKSETLKLEAIAEEFGVELQAHDALADIMASRKLLHLLMERFIQADGTVGGAA